ncbi:MAG: ferritin family protein, partial [Pseudomonadota bacterium]
MGDTEKNLVDAFALESQASCKYLAFAKQAEKEGYKQIAKLFRATAEAEAVHALSH